MKWIVQSGEMSSAFSDYSIHTHNPQQKQHLPFKSQSSIPLQQVVQQGQSTSKQSTARSDPKSQIESGMQPVKAFPSNRINSTKSANKTMGMRQAHASKQ
jgi:hypothetical protein